MYVAIRQLGPWKAREVSSVDVDGGMVRVDHYDWLLLHDRWDIQLN